MEKNSERTEDVLIRQNRKLLSELDHNEEELKHSDNENVVGYMKNAQLLFAQIKSPKGLDQHSERSWPHLS